MTAEGTPLGTSFDIFASLFNHSCDPNAHIFFEGRTLRVRSLRCIPSGEEITISYIGNRADVITRRADLKAKWFFHCDCKWPLRQPFQRVETCANLKMLYPGFKCKAEENRFPAELAVQDTTVEKVARAQSKAKNLIVELCLVPKSQCNCDKLLNFETRMQAIVETAFPRHAWPLSIYPMADFFRKLGGLYIREGILERGLQQVVLGCLPQEGRSGAEWADQLHELTQQVKHVIAVLDQLAQKAKEGGDDVRYEFSFPLARLREFYHRALHVLLVKTRLVYGKNTAFAMAIQDWYLNATAVCPQINDNAWHARYVANEVRITKWAKIKEGVTSGVGIIAIRKGDGGETISALVCRITG